MVASGVRGCSGGVRGCFGGHAWLLGGACVHGCSGGAYVVALGGMHGCWGGAHVVARGACMVAPGGHVWDTMRYRDMINERVVHVLLECILVAY